METSLFNAAIQGFLNLLHLKVLLAMMIGVSIGTFTAVAPQGLGMPLVYAILLPVVIKWEPITGIALLIGASSVSAICAAYLPILFGIPGGSGSQATVLDGYPMGKRGEGRRALGASFAGCLGATGTSGPGMDLKAETLGLAVALELPMVIVDVQRAGPSTGMPTKTEQGDLLLALFGRHGEAPMPVVAARRVPTTTTEMAMPPRILPKSSAMVSSSSAASPDFSRTTPMKTKRGTAMRVTFVMVPQMRRGRMSKKLAFRTPRPTPSMPKKM